MSNGFHDITLYGSDSTLGNLSFHNNLISSLYIDFLNGYKPKGTTRISVDIGNEDLVKGCFGSILTAEVAFNETEYWASASENRNKFMLDTVHRITILCAGKYGWDKSVFEAAYFKVIECGFIYKKEFKRKLSKDRKHQASILLKKNGQSAIISANFYSAGGEYLKSVTLLKTFDDTMFYGRLIGNSKWFNNLEFGMYTKNDELVIKASLNTDLPETVVTPIANTLEELEGHLRRITYREFRDNSDFIKWMNG